VKAHLQIAVMVDMDMSVLGSISARRTLIRIMHLPITIPIHIIRQ
jgi:hypothetical protein